MNFIFRSISGASFIVLLIFLLTNKKFSIRDLLSNTGKTLDEEQDKVENYFADLKLSVIFLFVIYVLSLFTPNDFDITTIPDSSIFSTVSHILNHTVIFAFAFSLHVLCSWQKKRKSRHSDTYFLAIIFISILIFLKNYLSDISAELRIPIFEAVYGFLLILLLFSSYFYTSKTSWIALLDRSNKVRLALYSFLHIVIITLIASSVDSSKLGDTLDHFIPGGAGLSLITTFIIIPHYLRILINSLLTLPTSAVVERKSSELSSLTYLNKVVAETKDFKKILAVVNELALRSTGAFASWTEVYENDKMKIAGMKNLTPEHVNSINSIPHLKEYLLSFKKPFLVESIKKNQICRDIQKVLPMANSLIFVPLFDNENRFGTVILLHIAEYGLEENDLKVLTAFSNNVSVALENSRLMKESLENERYKNEMLIAREMQEKLQPQTLFEIDSMTIDAFSIPADEVGGDYYDNFILKDGRQCFVVGDVSGKGTGSALFMAQVKGIAMSLASSCDSGKEFLEKINQTLSGTIESKLYITMGCLVLDNKRKKISYTRAGHMPLIHKNKNGVDFVKPRGLGIGLVAPEKFNELLEEVEIDISEKDIFVVFTDGVNELRNLDGIEYGYQSLEFLLEKYKYNSARNFNIKLKNSLENYGKNVKQHDDLTVLTLMAE